MGTGRSAIDSLDALSSALRTQLPLASNFNVVNTRLILQTGVNLKKIKPDQNQDPLLIRRVLDALDRMGVSVAGASP